MIETEIDLLKIGDSVIFNNSKAIICGFVTEQQWLSTYPTEWLLLATSQGQIIVNESLVRGNINVGPSNMILQYSKRGF